jgi:hypothetical protein
MNKRTYKYSSHYRIKKAKQRYSFANIFTIFLAVPMALRPATPPPITKIFAGGDFPAAVI